MQEISPFGGRSVVPNRQNVVWGLEPTFTLSNRKDPHTYDLTGTSIARGKTDLPKVKSRHLHAYKQTFFRQVFL